MQYFFKNVFLLTCFLSANLFAIQNNDDTSRHQSRLYFDSNNLEIINNEIYIHLNQNLIKTGVIRTDDQGLYIFE